MLEIIKKYLGEEVYYSSKSSEISNIKKEAEYLKKNTQASIILSLPLFMSLTSFILWNNKFTIFILVLFSLIESFCILATLISAKHFNKEIKKIKDKYR